MKIVCSNKYFVFPGFLLHHYLIYNMLPWDRVVLQVL